MVLLAALTAVALASVGSGIDVHLVPCNGNDTTLWAHVDEPNIPANSSFVVRGTSQCLNVCAWGKSAGDKVWTTQCSPETPPHVLNRVWLLQSNGTVLNPVSGLCVDGPSGAASVAGDTTQLRSCGAPDATRWSFDSADGKIRAESSGLCLALAGALPPAPPAPAPPAPPAPRDHATLTLGGIAPRAHSSDSYVSFNMDWHKNSEEPPAWINMSVTRLPLDNKMLRQAAAALAPAYLRIGGSEGDVAVYDVPQYNSTCVSMNQTDPDMCLSMDRWEQVVQFAADTGLQLVFGLNAIWGRSDHDQKKPLDLTNIGALLRYTAERKLRVHGFELGNEKPGIPADIYASDYKALRKLIDNLWPQSEDRPLLIGNDCNSDPKMLEQFLPQVADVLDVVTYHHYDGYGGDADLASKIMTPKFLDGTRQPHVVSAWRGGAPNAQLWVGEAAAAWHSGRAGVTNRFVSSFWYADALAGDAADNHTAYCRQTLVGGHYGLLNRSSFEPNPDYWVGKLHHDLMGNAVLDARISPSAAPNNTLRTYAHCSRTSGGVAVLLINIDASSSYTIRNIGATISTPSVQPVKLAPRTEFVLSAAALESQTVLLNGTPLKVTTDGKLPSLGSLAHKVDTDATDADAIVMAPQTIGYFVFPDASLPACAEVNNKYL